MLGEVNAYDGVPFAEKAQGELSSAAAKVEDGPVRLPDARIGKKVQDARRDLIDEIYEHRVVDAREDPTVGLHQPCLSCWEVVAIFPCLGGAAVPVQSPT
jgi:hypothetical protein